MYQLLLLWYTCWNQSWTIICKKFDVFLFVWKIWNKLFVPFYSLCWRFLFPIFCLNMLVVLMHLHLWFPISILFLVVTIVYINSIFFNILHLGLCLFTFCWFMFAYARLCLSLLCTSVLFLGLLHLFPCVRIGLLTLAYSSLLMAFIQTWFVPLMYFCSFVPTFVLLCLCLLMFAFTPFLPKFVRLM